LLARGW